MEYVSSVPQSPLADLIDDFYFLEGTPPYPRLMLPASPAAYLIVNLGAPFRIRGAATSETAEYADGCVVSSPTRAFEFGYPLPTRSIGVHFKPWGVAPFVPTPVSDLCDRPATLEQVWGAPAVAALRERLAAADGPHAMFTLLEDELLRRQREVPGLNLVRHAGGVIAEAGGSVAIGGLSAAAGVSATHLAQRFKAIVGITPKQMARAYRFAFTMLAIDPAEPVNWGHVAADAGYFDQAHFSRDFRAFTGLTPTAYIELRRRFQREHPGSVLDNWPLPID